MRGLTAGHATLQRPVAAWSRCRPAAPTTSPAREVRQHVRRYSPPAPGDEIQAYFEHVVDEYAVRPSIRFGVEIARCEFRQGRWELTATDYILQLMDEIRQGRCREIGASAVATSAFDATRVEASKGSIWATGCKSGHLDKHGIPASWPWSYGRFAAEMAKPRLEAYDVVA